MSNRSKCPHGVVGVMPNACGVCLDTAYERLTRELAEARALYPTTRDRATVRLSALMALQAERDQFKARLSEANEVAQMQAIATKNAIRDLEAENDRLIDELAQADQARAEWKQENDRLRAALERWLDDRSVRYMTHDKTCVCVVCGAREALRGALRSHE